MTQFCILVHGSCALAWHEVLTKDPTFQLQRWCTLCWGIRITNGWAVGLALDMWGGGRDQIGHQSCTSVLSYPSTHLFLQLLGLRSLKRVAEYVWSNVLSSPPSSLPVPHPFLVRSLCHRFLSLWLIPLDHHILPPLFWTFLDPPALLWCPVVSNEDDFSISVPDPKTSHLLHKESIIRRLRWL